MDAQSLRQESDKNENAGAEARRDAAQSHNYKSETENVNDDTGAFE